jgi:hypothetical protein
MCLVSIFHPPLSMKRQTIEDQGLPIVGAALSHSDSPKTGRNPLEEWSARRRALYLTTHDSHKGQTSRRPCLRRDSNPQSQQASGRKPTSQTAWSLVSAFSSVRNTQRATAFSLISLQKRLKYFRMVISKRDNFKEVLPTDSQWESTSVFFSHQPTKG